MNSEVRDTHNFIWIFGGFQIFLLFIIIKMIDLVNDNCT